MSGVVRCKRCKGPAPRPCRLIFGYCKHCHRGNLNSSINETIEKLAKNEYLE